MSGLTRGALAALLLQHDLPDGTVAAKMLLEADLTRPVVMRTAPDPSAVPSLWRSNWTKAATLANSCTDPEVLARLARHNSVQVRRAAAGNPNLPDDDRRHLEQQAIERDDREMLDAVLAGASWTYLVSLLSDVQRWESAKHRCRTTTAQQRYKDLVVNATPEQIEAMTVTGAASIMGVFDANSDQIDHLALTRDERLGSEVHLLYQLLSNRQVVDSVYIEALERFEALAPGRTMVTCGTHQIHADLSTADRDRLFDLCRDGAILAFLDRPDEDLLCRIEQRWGAVAAMTALRDLPPDERFVPHVLRLEGMGTSLHGVVADRYLQAFGIGSGHGRDLVLAGGTQTLRTWLSGAYGPVDADDVVDVLETDPKRHVSAFQYTRMDRHVEPILFRIVERGSRALLLESMHYMTRLVPEHAVQLLERMTAEAVFEPVSTLSQGEHRALLAGKHLEPSVLLTWLRCASSRTLTMDYLFGALACQPTMDVVEQLLAEPGRAFEGMSIGSVLARYFSSNADRKIGDLDTVLLDRLVDEAGTSLLEYVAQPDQSAHGPFGAYLADRIRRTDADEATWTAMFDLLARSSMPIGDTLRAAQRLHRRAER